MKASHVYLLGLVMLAFFWIIYRAVSSFGAGTHGSIASYNFPVSKDSLHAAVNKVIAANELIFNDTTPNISVDVTDGRNDTMFSYHYNDGNRYYTMAIKTGEESIRYTFQFTGSEVDWDTSKSAQISIVYAYDNYRDEGGSEGGGEIGWHTPRLKKRIMRLFEHEFINKLDKELHVIHTTSD